MKVNYDINYVNVVVLGWDFLIDTSSSGHGSISLYSGFVYEERYGSFSLTGETRYEGYEYVPPGTVSYTTDSDGLVLERLIWNIDGANKVNNLRIYRAALQRYIGSYRGRITAEHNTFPNNGEHTNGLWYTRIGPSEPTNLSPKTGTILNRETTVRFSWNHSNPYEDNPQSRFELVWRIIGKTVWNLFSEITTRQYQDVPAFTFPEASIEWQIRTFDQTGFPSEWSPIVVIVSGNKPESAMWVYPTSGQRIIDAKPTYQWSSNVQTAYRIILYNSINFIIWDTGEVTSQGKTIPSGVTLEDGLMYTVSVLIRNAENFWSEENKVSFTTSYSPPPKPELTLSSMGSTVKVKIYNQESTGVQPSTIRNEGYKLIDDEWVRIAKDISVNGDFTDYTARSNHEEQYKVKAIGDNEGIQYSDIGNITISFRGMYLHDTENPALTVHHFPFDGEGKSRNWTRDHALMKFKGRKKPVRETSENEEDTVKVSLSIVGQEELLALEKLVKSFGTLCYRDGRGRLLFGFVPSLPETDQTYGSTIDFNFIGLDYNGSV